MKMEKMKFRGKPVLGGSFIYGQLMLREEGYVFINESLQPVKHPFLSPWVPVLPSTVGQYVGIKDKNGVEIYEGDILHGCGVVVWVKWGPRFGILYDPNMFEAFFEDLEQYGFWVIGNIHDDPETVRENLGEEIVDMLEGRLTKVKDLRNEIEEGLLIPSLYPFV
jgi:hypothetical protein